ncbi:tctex1 domain-containing protein 1-like [Vespa mandarinia]|uniref:tctex1 domain-containing protein 1-like n=1 Tax=Vespa mandarinia TaxID=7446 RepID=UPI00160C9C36|nr:tctex1 domain-containing protein 1-like [Vespa mandarinia]
MTVPNESFIELVDEFDDTFAQLTYGSKVLYRDPWLKKVSSDVVDYELRNLTINMVSIVNKRNIRLSRQSLVNVEEGLGIYHDDYKSDKKKTLSRLSIVPTTSRFLFHLRGNQLKIPKYQNTYRLEPFRSFCVETVDNIVSTVMENKLSLFSFYQSDNASKLSMEISNDVFKAINKRDYDRYKIVVQVTIIQRMGQSVHSAFQCLWDVERDNYSYYVFENSHIYAWCCVFGLYYE